MTHKRHRLAWGCGWLAAALLLAGILVGPAALPVLDARLVQAAQSNDDPDQALRYVRSAVQWRPASAPLHLALGSLLYQQGGAQEALPSLKQAVALDPDLAAARNNLGVVYLALGQPASARLHLQAAVNLDPANAEVWRNLGQAQMALAQPGEAALAYQRALDLQPQDVDLRAEWAEALAASGKFEAAQAEWQTVLASDPQHALANRGLGSLALWANQPQDALAYLHTASLRDPADPGTWVLIGMAFEGQQRLTEALIAYQRALELGGDTPGIAASAQRYLLALLPVLGSSKGGVIP